MVVGWGWGDEQRSAETQSMEKLFSPSVLGKMEIPRAKKDAMNDSGSWDAC